MVISGLNQQGAAEARRLRFNLAHNVQGTFQISLSIPCERVTLSYRRVCGAVRVEQWSREKMEIVTAAGFKHDYQAAAEAPNVHRHYGGHQLASGASTQA